MTTSENCAIDKLFCREMLNQLEQSMQKIEHCLGQLSIDQIWFRTDESHNSTGNLLLHLSGNLRQWVVSGVAQSPDERNRETEFTSRDRIEADLLLDRLRATVAEAHAIIENLDQASLEQPRIIQGFQTNVLAAVAHSVSHFVGHTHQIVTLTRQQLGDRYRFHWTPDGDRRNVPI